MIIGVTREVFGETNAVLQRKYKEERAQSGVPGMPVELRLTLALEYWREYRTFRYMANDHQIGKSKINNAVIWVEDVLSESEEFKLKELKERLKPNEEAEIKVILIDVEEQLIERPKYDQKDSYSGKKTAHDKISNNSRSGNIRNIGRI